MVGYAMDMAKRSKSMQADSTSRSVGRPRLSERGSVQVAIRFPAEIMDSIDEIIEERFGQSDRTAIIRELVAEALEGRKRR